MSNKIFMAYYGDLDEIDKKSLTQNFSGNRLRDNYVVDIYHIGGSTVLVEGRVLSISAEDKNQVNDSLRSIQRTLDKDLRFIGWSK